MRAFILTLCLLLLNCGKTTRRASEPEAPGATSWHSFDVLWRTAPNQSNGYGTNPGLSYTNAAVAYWDSYVLTSADDPDADKAADAFTSINGHHGADSAIAKAMVDAGLNPIIVNVSRGATFSSNWIIRERPEVVYVNARAEVEQAWAELQALRPGAVFRHWHVVDQGEAEIRYGYPTPTGPELAVINAWESNASAAHDWLEDVIGAPIDRLIFLTNYNIFHASRPDLIRAQQLSWAGPDRSINCDAFGWESDGVHKTTPGHIDAGTTAGQRIVQLVNMGSLNPSIRSGLVDQHNDVAVRTPAATHYFEQRDEGGTPIGARVAKTNDTTTWPGAVGRSTSIGVEVVFEPPGSAVDICSVAIFDAPSGGLQIGVDWFDPVAVGADDVFRINAGGITVNAPAGSLADAEVQTLLNLEFGAQSYSARTIVHGSYWLGKPSAGGSLLGSSVAITQATTWAPAVNGLARNIAPIAIADQWRATHWATHTATAGGGSLISEELLERPAMGGGVIAANRIHTQL